MCARVGSLQRACPYGSRPRQSGRGPNCETASPPPHQTPLLPHPPPHRCGLWGQQSGRAALWRSLTRQRCSTTKPSTSTQRETLPREPRAAAPAAAGGSRRAPRPPPLAQPAAMSQRSSGWLRRWGPRRVWEEGLFINAGASTVLLNGGGAELLSVEYPSGKYFQWKAELLSFEGKKVPSANCPALLSAGGAPQVLHAVRGGGARRPPRGAAQGRGRGQGGVAAADGGALRGAQHLRQAVCAALRGVLVAAVA